MIDTTSPPRRPRMRWTIILLTGLCVHADAFGQQPPTLNPRYSLEFDIDGYRQDTPKETLASVIKAIEQKKVDYLLAHLADPLFVEARVAEVHKGSFPAMVQETLAKLRDDPESIALLRRFLNEGQFDNEDMEGRATLKGAKDRLYFKRYETRWFLENRRK
jgi:hypothetical protein